MASKLLINGLMNFFVSLLALFLLIFPACSSGVGTSGTAGSVTGSSGEGADTGSSESTDTGATGDNGFTITDIGTTNVDAPETTSIYISSLTTGNVYVANNDSSQDVPATLTDGAVSSEYTTDADGNNYSDSYQVAISSEPLTETTSSRIEDGGSKMEDGESSFRSSTFYLLSSISPFGRDAHADTTFPACDGVTVQCFPISSTGSLQAFYHLTNASVSTLYLAITDSAGNIGAPITENIIGNLLYTGTTAAGDVSIANGNINAITNPSTGSGQAISAKLTGTEWNTQGSHLNDYLSWTNDTAGGETTFGTQFDFNQTSDTACTYFGVLNSTDGIHKHKLNTDGTVSFSEIVTAPDAVDAYTSIKFTSNSNLMYAVQRSASEAHIYHVLEGDPNCDPTSGTDIFTGTSDIQFLQTSDGITHAKTIDFDAVTLNTDGVNKNYAFALMTDSSGRYRVRMGTYYDYTTTTFGTALGTTTDFSGLKQAMVYYNQTNGSVMGKAALRDETNNKIWIVNYDVTRNRVNFSTDRYVTVGNHPSAMVLNSDRSKMYVANYNDGTVSVISLTSAGSPITPVVTATFDLKAAYFPDKNVTLHPNAIQYYNGQLIISCEGLNGLLIVNTSEIPEPTS